jgi:DNA modification methylase
MSVRIIRGDCRDVLKTLADASVHCVLTSPPYWGLRSYLPTDHPEKHREIGSEPTVDAWVQTMVGVMREVRRVLRDDGTCFLNLGDSYAGSRCGGQSGSTTLRNAGHKVDQSAIARREQRAMTASGRRDNLPIPRSDLVVDGLKPKDLVGQPWRLAFALQADGWWLRQDIVWAKRNPMPESARDRFTKAHETIFLLTKRARYYWDFAAIQQPASMDSHARRASTGVGFGHGFDDTEKPRYTVPGNKAHSATAAYEAGDEHHRTKGGLVKYAARQRERAEASARMGREPGWRDRTPSGWATGTEREHLELDGRFSAERKALAEGRDRKSNESFDAALGDAGLTATRNPRDVFFGLEDEFQQFLRWKAEQPIAPDVISLTSEPFRGAHFATFPPSLIEPFILAGCPEGGTVLDPFGGSGTTGLVADRHHRHAVLIDLDERNVPMAESRIAAEAGLFSDIGVTP